MAISIRGLSFGYNKEPLIQNFNAKFERGEIVAVTGKNGAGKTTLAKIIVGILRADEGSIYIDEILNKDLNLAQIGKKIGFVMQNPNHQIFNTTVREEVELGLQNINLDKDEISDRCDEYLEYFNLKRYENRFPYELSTGEKQRLILASVLSMKPGYLLLDEPTASIDYIRKEILGKYLLKVKSESNCGIVVISHDRKFVDTYCDREVRL